MTPRSTPPSASASPTRWSSRSSPPSAWRSSSTPSAGSCCSCPRRAVRRSSRSSPRSSSPSGSSSPSCRRSSPALIAVVAVIAGLGLVAGGAAAALDGEREMHPHETTSALAAEGECDTTEETEADEHASQTVAAKANITAEVTLHDDDTLVAHNLGVTGSERQRGRRHQGQPDERPLPQRERRGAPPRARHGHPAGAGRRRATRSPTPRSPTSSARSSSTRAAASC